MEESDWPRAFPAITEEPEFSRTCGFHRIVKNNILNDFSKKKVYTNDQDFDKNMKNHMFVYFFLNFGPEKSGFVTFLHL